jgi:ABC-type branched-subunit amino acid transport system ATPase component
MKAPTVAVKDLKVAFGELGAVEGVSFTVGRGEVFGSLTPIAPASPPPCAS